VVTPYNVKNLGLIAGGTGITPMLQIIRDIAHNPDDHTIVHLIFANQTEEDIFLRQELESLPRDRFHLWYTLDRPPADWKYSTGFINADMCKKHLPAPGPDSYYFVCGPPPMVKFACAPSFAEIGITEDMWHDF
jgi:cytochrome-b5 reductase